MTFSLVARCAETGMLGIAISSSSPAVAARCAYTRAGVGAVASQNITDPRLGPLVLDRMEIGLSATDAIEAMRKECEFLDYRQVLAVDKHGGTAIHSGGNALGIWSEAKAENVASGGNLLANADVPAAIVAAFTDSKGHLGDRLIAAMKAGLAAGGEAGPVHSRRHADRGRTRLARRGPALRLDGGLPDRGSGDGMGDLQAPARRLRHARARSERGTVLWRAGGRVS